MGLIVAFISAVLASSKDIVSKHLSVRVTSTVSTFASFFFALPFYLFLILLLYLAGFESLSIPSGFLVLVVLRGLTDTAAEWLKMSALAHGDISIVILFVSLSPLFLLVTSPLITGDPITLSGIIGIILIAFGSGVAVIGPHSTQQKLPAKGIILGICGAFFFSLNSCFDRLAVQKASATLSGFSMTLFSALILTPFFLRDRTGTSAIIQNKKPFLVRGAIEVVFMVTKLLALQYMQAPYVVGIQKFSLVISVIAGKFVFREKEVKRRLVAAALILAGIGTIVIKEF